MYKVPRQGNRWWCLLLFGSETKRKELKSFEKKKRWSETG